MRNLKLVPLNRADPGAVAALMLEEEQAWMKELGWDYSPVRRILASFLERDLLPGYVAADASRALGYTYYLLHGHKGIIGTLFVSDPDGPQEVTAPILALAVDSLRRTPQIRRIESQIIPFHTVKLVEQFTKHGFQHYPRCYLELPLGTYPADRHSHPDVRIVSWNEACALLAAEVAFMSYRDETDALICEDYGSVNGCASYLRSLTENPGCGIFRPEGSFAALDSQSSLCGFVISSRISRSVGMIPQIAVLPAHQGRGVGTALIHQSLSRFKASGFRSVCLTVTRKNRRAFEWYQRLGFKIRKEFGAFVWNRN